MSAYLNYFAYMYIQLQSFDIYFTSTLFMIQHNRDVDIEGLLLLTMILALTTCTSQTEQIPLALRVCSVHQNKQKATHLFIYSVECAQIINEDIRKHSTKQLNLCPWFTILLRLDCVIYVKLNYVSRQHVQLYHIYCLFCI